MLDWVLLAKAALMGVVEGLTEFLPISSTGHLILAGSLLGFVGEKAKVFEIAIQSGAMLAVILVYWQRLRDTVLELGSSARARAFVANVAIAFAPAVVLGLSLGKLIKSQLFNAPVVASSFIVGGLIILWAERRTTVAARIDSVDAMTRLDALKVGLAQCVAMIPGTSRSGATIIGGMLFGLSRAAATEFSFLSGDSHADGRGCLQLVQGARAALRCRLAAVPGWCAGLVCQRLCMRALVATLHRQPHLRAVRVVSHRLRRHGVGHRLERPGAVGRLRT
jgi:undecaprenyl-diphosphatase